MDRRTKIFGALFGACLAYALISSVAYPRWIEPVFTIDERIAQQKKEFEKLDAVEADVHLAKLEYRDLLDRMCSKSSA